MTIDEAITKVNEFTAKFSFYEFSIYTYSKEKLVIVGSSDMLYYHNLEIHFIDTFYFKSKCNWIVDTSKPVLQTLEGVELIEFNKENKIETGNKTIKFLDQDNLYYYYSFAAIDLVIDVTKYDK